MTLNRSSVTFGTLFLVIGAMFLLDDLGVLTVRLSTLVPVLLIVAGVALTATAMSGERR